MLPAVTLLRCHPLTSSLPAACFLMLGTICFGFVLLIDYPGSLHLSLTW